MTSLHRPLLADAALQQARRRPRRSGFPVWLFASCPTSLPPLSSSGRRKGQIEACFSNRERFNNAIDSFTFFSV